MKLSDLIKKLIAIRTEEGDLNVCVATDHEYWGSVHKYIEDTDVRVTDNAQPEGPKSGKGERAVLIEY